MREALPRAARGACRGVRLVLAAMGPKMCRLAGSQYDGAFFNWMTPGFAAVGARATSRPARRAGAARRRSSATSARRSATDAAERLAKEEAFYRDLHDGYRNHFDRLDEPEGTVGVAAADARRGPARARRLRRRSTSTVVRGLASATVEAMTARRRGCGAVASCDVRRRSPRLGRLAALRRPRRARRAGPEAAARPRRAAGSPTRSGRVVILHGFNMVYKVGSYRARRHRLRRATTPASCAATASTRSGSGSSTRALEPEPPGAEWPRLRRGLPAQHRPHRAHARAAADLHPARLPPGPLQRALRGRGLARLGRRSTTASRPSRRPAFPPTTSSTPGLQPRLRQLLGQRRGRGPRPPGRLRRRLAPRRRQASATALRDGLRPPQRALAGLGLRPTAALRPGGCPTFDTTTLTAVLTERVIDAIRAVDHRDADLLRAARHLRLRRRHAPSATPAIPRAGFSFHVYCLPGAFGGPASGPACEPLEELVFDNADDARRAETGDVPFLTEFGATDDLDAIERIVAPRRRPHGLLAVLALLRLRRPDHRGPGRPGARPRPAQAAARRQRQAREAAVLARPYPRAVAGTPQRFGFDPDTRASSSPTRGAHCPPATTPAAQAARHRGLPAPRIQYPRAVPRSTPTGAEVVSDRALDQGAAPRSATAGRIDRVELDRSLPSSRPSPSRSVGRQVLVPVAERAERRPELALGAPRSRASRRCRARRARRSSASAAGSRPGRGSSSRASGISRSLRVSSARSPMTTTQRGWTIAISSTRRSTHSSAASAGSETGHLTQRVP